MVFGMEEGRVCSVVNCGANAVRSISLEKFKGVDLNVNPVRRRVYLCKEHYKIYKKQRKKFERLERLRWK
jgi:hypothetical protein